MFNNCDRAQLAHIQSKVNNIEFLLDLICKRFTVLINHENLQGTKKEFWLGSKNLKKYSELQQKYPEITAVVTELLRMYSGVDFSASENKPGNSYGDTDNGN